MYGVELAIIIAATLGQALSAPSEAVTMTGLLIFWRVVMGIGIGGDYPLSAIITSEYVHSAGCILGHLETWIEAPKLSSVFIALLFKSTLLSGPSSKFR